MKKAVFSIMVMGAATLAMADGAKLFEVCAVCHGDRGQKKSLNVSAVIAGWNEAKTIDRLKAYKAGKLNQYGYGNMMGGQATKLTDAQMKEVAHYISTLKPPADNNETAAAKELTPEEIEYAKFMRDYFKNNPKNGTIREATKLWEERKKSK